VPNGDAQPGYAAAVLLLFALACDDATVPADLPCPLATDTRVETEDGATIALHHHPGRGAPVLLVHGVSSNHRFWDLDADHSLARWLVNEGFDPWVLDLRGHGNARDTVDGAWQVRGWTVDDYGRRDVAAAVAHVRRVTGAAKVGYVGHSMGGMVGAVYAVDGGASTLSSIVMVGSPATFRRDAPLMEPARVAMGLAGAGLLYVDSAMGAEIAATAGDAVPGRVHRLLYNPAHFRPATERAMLQRIVSPMSREEMQHFSRMLTNERFESADGKVDWTEAFHGVGVPVLAIAGGADQVGRPEFVRPWTEGHAAATRYVEIPEYGHLDLGLGEDAEIDVFPLIGAWLREHPAAR
jgi:pimeloyl-ACP methyl ester carboxylesterase